MRRFGPLVPAFLSLSFALAPAGPALAAKRQPLEIATSGGTLSFSVELANTHRGLDRGLMYRRALPRGQGMLFDFGSEQRINMWMKNTYVPLSVAFMDEQGTIVSIHDMQPQNETSHCAAKPARFAL